MLSGCKKKRKKKKPIDSPPAACRTKPGEQQATADQHQHWNSQGIKMIVLHSMLMNTQKGGGGSDEVGQLFKLPYLSFSNPKIII